MTGTETETGTIISSSWVPGPLYACLKKADDRLGPDRTWNGSTPEQEEFLSYYAAVLADLGLLSEDEFRTMLSDSADEINAWLARNGFNIKLEALEPGQFGTAAIVRLAAEWSVKGTSAEIKMENGQTLPGVLMDEASFKGFVSPKHGNPIACISGKNGSQWYITKADRSLEGQALFAHLKAIDESLSRYRAEELRFPKVDYDQSIEPQVMAGLHTLDQEDRPWVVAQAVQQTRIKMNELGGLAESAAAVGFECTCVRETPPPIIIDGPMWLWIKGKGMKLPLFAAQLGYDSLKDPGAIEFDKPVVA